MRYVRPVPPRITLHIEQCHVFYRKMKAIKWCKQNRIQSNVYAVRMLCHINILLVYRFIQRRVAYIQRKPKYIVYHYILNAPLERFRCHYPLFFHLSFCSTRVRNLDLRKTFIVPSYSNKWEAFVCSVQIITVCSRDCWRKFHGRFKGIILCESQVWRCVVQRWQRL